MNAKGLIVIVAILLVFVYLMATSVSQMSGQRYSSTPNPSNSGTFVPSTTPAKTIEYMIAQSNMCKSGDSPYVVTSRNGCLWISVSPTIDNVIYEIYMDEYMIGQSYAGLALPLTTSHPEGTYNIKLITKNGDFSITVPLTYGKTTMINVFV